MKVGSVPVLLLFLAAASQQQASATVATLGVSKQTFSLTGIGPNASGQGQSKMTWGSCAFDGTNTNCTLSGSFTGFAGGGTYSFVVSYPGTGAFPLIAVTNPGSDQFFAQALSAYSFKITLVENSGPTVSFYSFANFGFLFSGATCTGVGTCNVGPVGQTQNATISGPIVGTFDPTPFVSPSGVISAGNYGAFPIIAPATWIEIYGVNLATTPSQTWGGGGFQWEPGAVSSRWNHGDGGRKVRLRRFRQPRSSQCPGALRCCRRARSRSWSRRQADRVRAYTVTVKAQEPGLLAPPAFILKGLQNVVALFSGTLTYVLPVNVAGVVTARARPGDNITLYGIGFGTVTPDTPAGQIVQQTNSLQSDLQVSFGGVPANVTYKGFAPGYVGLYQFNVVVPNVAASDAVPLTFTLGGTPGPQNLFIAVQN